MHGGIAQRGQHLRSVALTHPARIFSQRHVTHVMQLAASEAEGVSEGRALSASQRRDSRQALASHEQAEDDQVQNSGERMEASVAAAGIGEFGEDIGEREWGHAGLQDTGAATPIYPKRNSLPTPNIERPCRAPRVSIQVRIDTPAVSGV